MFWNVAPIHEFQRAESIHVAQIRLNRYQAEEQLCNYMKKKKKKNIQSGHKEHLMSAIEKYVLKV